MLSYSLVLYCLKISIPWRIKHDRSWLSCFSGNQCSFYIGNAIKATVLGGIAWMSVCDSGKIGRQKNWWIKNLIYFIWNCDIRHVLRPSIKCQVLLSINSMNFHQKKSKVSADFKHLHVLWCTCAYTHFLDWNISMNERMNEYKKTLSNIFCITIFSTIHWIERLTAYQHVCKPKIGIWYAHTNSPVSSMTYTLTCPYS